MYRNPLKSVIGPNPYCGDIQLNIYLRPTFPKSAPYVIIEPAPGKQLLATDYLYGCEIRIPYLVGWNASASNLVIPCSEIST